MAHFREYYDLTTKADSHKWTERCNFKATPDKCDGCLTIDETAFCPSVVLRINITTP